MPRTAFVLLFRLQAKNNYIIYLLFIIYYFEKANYNGYLFFNAIPPHPRRVERYTRNLARRCVAAGHRALVVTASLPGLPARERDADGIEIYRLPSLACHGRAVPRVKALLPMQTTSGHRASTLRSSRPGCTRKASGPHGSVSGAASRRWSSTTHRLYAAWRAGRGAGQGV